ncbi:MAG: type IVB secretion system protein IcmH/DotU [Methylococcaceae bacterium]|jgi:type VI secretion system protein ImpK
MNHPSMPSLLGHSTVSPGFSDTAFTPRSLLDLMYDGFYALFLLNSQSKPSDYTSFADSVSRFLDDFESRAKKLGAPAEDIQAAKYAYCAAVDETVLKSGFSIRAEWERMPLQLSLFGGQLAGEAFFQRLDGLRQQGASHIQALEVFHICLLLGFEGKYMLEGAEKLSYLTARLGSEIALLKGKGTGFAPHGERPDHIINKLRHEAPLWLIAAVFAVLGLAAYGGLDNYLGQATQDSLASYNGVVQLPPETANITITLP